jgi:hypothetical protein
MPVDSQHESYVAYLPLWQRVDDVVAGEDAVKAKGETYLPRVSSRQKDKPYEAYKTRTFFLEAAAGTVDGLLGLVFRRPPQVTMPERVEALTTLKDNATLSGIPLEDFILQVHEGVVKKGRYGVLVEFSDAHQRPFLIGYAAEDIINWGEEIINGATVTTLVVLREMEEVRSEDGFEVTRAARYRVLRLEEGICTQTIWRSVTTTGANGEQVTTLTPGETTVPLAADAPLRQIPFVFFGPKDLTPAVQRPPILGLVNTNLAHYRRSAEWATGLHAVAMPTPWVTGYKSEEDAEPQEIGPGVMLEYERPEAKVGMLEVSGAGLGLVWQDLKGLEAHMASQGAQMLETEKREAEAAETLRLRQAGRGATLTTMARTVGRGFTVALGYAAAFARVDPAAVSCAVNTDFFDAELPHEKLTALVASWQKGAITRKTLAYNLKRGELLEPEATVEGYLAELQAEQASRQAAPTPQPQPAPLPAAE